MRRLGAGGLRRGAADRADTHPWSGFDPQVADPETARLLWGHSLDLIRELGGEATITM
jgi:hypothetical protein